MQTFNVLFVQKYINKQLKIAMNSEYTIKILSIKHNKYIYYMGIYLFTLIQFFKNNSTMSRIKSCTNIILMYVPIKLP